MKGALKLQQMYFFDVRILMMPAQAGLEHKQTLSVLDELAFLIKVKISVHVYLLFLINLKKENRLGKLNEKNINSSKSWINSFY